MRRLSLAVSLTATSLALAACGSNSLASNAPTASGTVTATADPSVVALVPPAIKAKGTLNVGSDASYAPDEFLASDGTTVVGFDVDLFKAVAATMGLKANFQNASFGTIIAGVSSAKYDVGVSSFTINSAREKQALMISYFSSGTQWATTAGNPKSVNPDAACGLHIAVQSNTVEVPDIQARSTACTKAGKPAITIDQYDRQDRATAAVVAGKDDAMLADSPITAYAVKQSKGKLETLGAIYAAAPYGFVVPKGSQQLAHAIQAALKVLAANGVYKKALEDWGVGQGAVTSFDINPPASN